MIIPRHERWDVKLVRMQDFRLLMQCMHKLSWAGFNFECIKYFQHIADIFKDIAAGNILTHHIDRHRFQASPSGKFLSLGVGGWHRASPPTTRRQTCKRCLTILYNTQRFTFAFSQQKVPRYMIYPQYICTAVTILVPLSQSNNIAKKSAFKQKRGHESTTGIHLIDE